MSRVRFTLSSRLDLQEIGDFIAKDNEHAAHQLIVRLEERCGSLASNNRIGRQRTDIRPDVRSITEGLYVILYRIVKDDIQILRIVHGKRDIAKLTLPD